MQPMQITAKGQVTLIERMRGKATVNMTTDEIMALTRGDG